MSKERFFHLRMINNPLGAFEESRRSDEEAMKGGAAETETPLVDIYEQGEAVVIEADLPGIEPAQMAVRLMDDQVTIEGRRGQRGEGQEAGNYLRMERCFEDFRRVIRLPFAVDPQKAEASYRQGVLILRFPKIEDRRKRAIKIEIK
ncbi:MAG: Hsp20/alpha crystallin family protein [Nitrospirae bacterium]|nr:Hsp20/alpha crystallin family protein [Nitrospirota bacterium]